MRTGLCVKALPGNVIVQPFFPLAVTDTPVWGFERAVGENRSGHLMERTRRPWGPGTPCGPTVPAVRSHLVFLPFLRSGPTGVALEPDCPAAPATRARRPELAAMKSSSVNEPSATSSLLTASGAIRDGVTALGATSSSSRTRGRDPPSGRRGWQSHASRRSGTERHSGVRRSGEGEEQRKRRDGMALQHVKDATGHARWLLVRVKLSRLLRPFCGHRDAMGPSFARTVRQSILAAGVAHSDRRSRTSVTPECRAPRSPLRASAGPACATPGRPPQQVLHRDRTPLVGGKKGGRDGAVADRPIREP